MTFRNSASGLNAAKGKPVVTGRGHQAEFDALIKEAMSAEVKKKPAVEGRSPFTLLFRLLSFGLWRPESTEVTRKGKRTYVLG